MNGSLKWKAYRKVKGKVATKAGMHYGEMVFLILVGRIDGFHTHIKTHHEEIEVQADSQTIADG